MFALSTVSVFKIPFSPSEVIPDASFFLRDLTNDQNLLHFSFLSHLLIAGCDIGVQISVRPYVRASFVRSFVRQHLRRSLVFSTSMIAASLKPCIVIVLDIPSSTHLDPVPLTYISRSTDFENFYVEVWFSRHQ